MRVLIAGLLGLTACAATPDAPTSPTPAWQGTIRPADRDRLARLDDAWRQALRQAEAAGHRADLNGLGALVDPRAGTGDTPPAGRYRCRTVKLGAQQPGLLDFIAYPFFACRVTGSGDGVELMKDTGSQRPAGRLYRDHARVIFLGGLSLGDGEAGPRPYGVDAERDLVGVVERIGERRWRLVLPWPRYESKLDLIELLPVE